MKAGPKGIAGINSHQPVLFVSWYLLAANPRLGIAIARFHMSLNKLKSSLKPNRSISRASKENPMIIDHKMKCQYPGLLTLPLKLK